MEQSVIIEMLKSKKISAYRLAKDCNISTSDIYQILHGKKPLFPKWRKAISEYLDIDEKVLM